MGRTPSLYVRVDMNRLVEEICQLLMPEWRDRDIKRDIANLPAVQ
jgi:hypothetical protein